MSNFTGDLSCGTRTRANDLRAFDRLPAEIRPRLRRGQGQPVLGVHSGHGAPQRYRGDAALARFRADAPPGLRRGDRLLQVQVRVPGMFAVDADGDEGEQSLTHLQEHYGPLPTAAPMQLTGSGNGCQILLQWHTQGRTGGS